MVWWGFIEKGTAVFTEECVISIRTASTLLCRRAKITLMRSGAGKELSWGGVCVLTRRLCEGGASDVVLSYTSLRLCFC